MTFDPVSDVLKRTVEDLQGVHIGRVDELLIERNSGRIAYVRFVCQAESGAEERRVTVPWTAFRTMPGGSESLRLPVRQAVLRKLLDSMPV